ncbi:hypothetical protein B0H21DRAFT_693024 [Amylocystis lapponica]|nr:hypothetical protein B0H21DRAFT_693024 [Amylocystis lapponica]
MPASEIDDIFASSKGKKAPVPLISQPSTSQSPSSKKKKKDARLKRKRDSDAEDGPSDKQPGKCRVPETILDPSASLPISSKAKPVTIPKATSSALKTKKVERDAEQRFKDSRGTGSRRKTDEGFAIYKEDELGITEQGGGKHPLLPLIMTASEQMGHRYASLSI